jgi:DNA-binding response OmpR family regulator
MDKVPAELDHFVHAVISPLTVLQGTAGLLRRRLEHSDDKLLLELLTTMERATERLRQVSELLIHSAELHDELISIEVPADAFMPGGLARSATAAARPATVAAAGRTLAPRRAPRGRAGGGPILMLARPEGAALAIGQVMQAHGHELLWVGVAAEGLDLARGRRPAALIVDPQLDEQAATVIDVLGADPDTKMIPVARLGTAAEAARADGPLILDPALPAEQAVAALLGAIDMSTDGRDANPHILIIDDEPEIGNLIALQFQEEGYLTTQLSSGTEALRMVRQQSFDLILLDLLLPDLDGFAVLGGLRAQPETQLTPIILLSAINSAADKVRGLQLGADDYITKPFSGPELSARVQAAMRRSEREGGANPSTRLPGNTAIERAIARRIEQGAQFVVSYVDLDNFKAYNDTYGFLKGDAVIQRTAQILLDAVREYGNADDFVGHIGGDDFVVISTPERSHLISASVVARFDAVAPLFYDREARARGFISGVDRQGNPARFHLLSISIAMMSSEQRPFEHPGEVAQRSVEPKKQAKSIPGSVFLLDE